MNVNHIRPDSLGGPDPADRGRFDKLRSKAEGSTSESSSRHADSDRIDLSHAAEFEREAERLVKVLRKSENHSEEKVAQARKLVASGELENRERIEKAANNLFESGDLYLRA